MLQRLSTLITLSLSLATLAPAQVAMDWTSIGGGTLSGRTVTASGFSGATIAAHSFSGSEFCGAPLPGFSEAMTYHCNSAWSVTFSPSIPAVLWYGRFLRGAGSNGNGAPVEYTFDRPFTIVSGFSQAEAVGSTLRLPGSGFHDGILRFAGNVSSLACSSTATTNNNQSCTFGELDASIGSTYCSTAVANSTGSPAEMFALGSNVASDNFLLLGARSLPTNAFAFFLTSRDVGFSAMPGGSFGNLCLSGSIGRFVGPGQIRFSGAAGEILLKLDLDRHPTPSGLVRVSTGETWHFQCWYRDSVAGTPGSNFSDGLTVVFD